MGNEPQPPRRSRQRLFTLVGLAVLVAINAFLLSRPFVHEAGDVVEWRKGPLVYEHSPFFTANAAKVFWPALAVALDAYLLTLSVWGTFLRRRLTGRLTAALARLAPLLFVFAALALGEGVSRYVIKNSDMYDQYRPDADLFWYNRPNLRDFVGDRDSAPRSTNSRGFRGAEEVPKAKAENEYRIFVVGDSSTFGLGVKDDQTYAAVMGATMDAASARDVRVINTGCPGHTSHQGLVLLRRYGPTMKPDLIVWSYNNDPCLDMARDKDRLAPNRAVLALQRFVYRSDLFLVSQRVYLDWVYGRNLQKYSELYPSESSGWVRRIPFDDYRQYLDEFIEVADDLGSEILFIRMPLNRAACEEKPIYFTSYDDEYRDYLTTWARENHHHCVDFESMFEGLSGRELFLPGHLFHPAVDGHDIIGRNLATYALDMELIEP